MEIITKIAEDRLVESMVCNIAGRDRITGDLCDLVQMVYLVLLEYDDDKILDLWTNGEIRFFIARIITNQLNSRTSPFWRIIRKFGHLSTEIGPNEYNLPDA